MQFYHELPFILQFNPQLYRDLKKARTIKIYVILYSEIFSALETRLYTPVVTCNLKIK